MNGFESIKLFLKRRSKERIEDVESGLHYDGVYGL